MLEEAKKEYNLVYLYYCYLENKKKLPFWVWLVSHFIRYEIEMKIRKIVCKRVGHKWIDTSCIGPDSGTESGHCERCGFHFSHTYY